MSKISGSNITITAGKGVTIENSTIESRNIIGASGIQQTSQENDIQPKIQLDFFIRHIQQLLNSRDNEQLKFLSDNNGKDVLESMISGARPNDLLTFKKLINSIALVRDVPNYLCGTIFIAKVEGLGVYLFGAGHIFGSILHGRSTQITLKQLQSFLASLGDIDGDISNPCPEESLEKGRPMNLKLFFDKFAMCGSIRHDGKRKVFNRVNDKWITDFKSDLETSIDYFAMLLKSDIENHLDDLGLEILRVASGNSLKHQLDKVVTIIGHHRHEDWEKYPRRISYGLEKGVQNNMTKLSSSYDSLPGNSGSPVFGENYQVKGIHVSGGASVNYMQNLENVEKWIEVGRNLSE